MLQNSWGGPPGLRGSSRTRSSRNEISHIRARQADVDVGRSRWSPAPLPRPLRIGASTELQNRHTVALQPKPVVIPKIGPEVAGGRWISSRVQSEVMRVFMYQRGVASIPQAQEGLVERIPSGSPAGWTWPYRTAPCTIPINVVTQRVRHEEVDRCRRQKFRRDFRVSLLPQISAFQHGDEKTNSTGGVFAARLFLIVPELGKLAFS